MDVVILVTLFMSDYRSVRAASRAYRQRIDSEWYLGQREASLEDIPRTPLTALEYHYEIEDIRRALNSRTLRLSDIAIDIFARHINWEILCLKQPLSLEVISSNYRRVQWDTLVMSRHLTPEVADKYHSKVCNAVAITYVQFPERILGQYAAKFPAAISQYQRLTCEFIDRHIGDLDIRTLCVYQVLTESFMDKHCTRLSWREVSRHQVMSVDFMRRHSGRIYWEEVSCYQPLTYDVMVSFGHVLDWRAMIENQEIDNYYMFVEAAGSRMMWDVLCILRVLPVDFLDAYSDRIVWESVSLYQPLTADFLRKYKDRISWHRVLDNELISLTREEKIEFIDYLFPGKNEGES